MSDAQTLLARCQELGASLTPSSDGKLKVRAPAPLPEELQDELKRHKAEVLTLLEACAWLRSKLTTPQRIAPLIAEWVGTLDRPTGRTMDALMQARWTLGVQAYVSEDDRHWWRLPPAKVAKPAKPPSEISNFSRFRGGNPAKLQNPEQPQRGVSNRVFLSRPLGQENNPDPWDAWAPFMSWLRVEHPDRFTAVCAAEETIRALEREGITTGQEYEQACAELLRRFEEARRLRFKEGVKVWMQ